MVDSVSCNGGHIIDRDTLAMYGVWTMFKSKSGAEAT